MESYDFFSYQVNIYRPVFFVKRRIVRISQSGDVVCKCVEPYVDDVLFIDRHRDAPVEGGSGDAKVFQSLFHECDHLISSAVRLEEFRVFLEHFQQSVLIFGKAEEVSFFLGFLHRSAAVRAFAVHQLAFSPEGFTRRAVHAFVFTFVDIALFVKLHEDLLHPLHVARFCSSNEIVIGDLHGLPQVFDTGNDLINVFLRRYAFFLRDILDLLSVFVSSREKSHVVACQALETCHGVCHNGAVRVSDMEIGTRVIDRGRDVILAF